MRSSTLDLSITTFSYQVVAKEVHNSRRGLLNNLQTRTSLEFSSFIWEVALGREVLAIDNLQKRWKILGALFANPIEVGGLPQRE